MQNSIDSKKLYEVSVLSVKPTYRARFNCQGLQIVFLVKDTGQTTPRTFTLPRSFKKAKDCISRFIAPVTSLCLKDEMIDKPNLLAKEIESAFSHKKLGARLGLSKTGHINIVDLELMEEGA